MWIKTNPNPKRKHVPDCVVRAICIALNMSWYEAYDGICRMGRIDCSMPSDDNVWGHYLLLLGFKPFVLTKNCPSCITVGEFCQLFPKGVYIVGTGQHAIAIIDGDYYDTFDSAQEVLSFFWKINK